MKVCTSSACLAALLMAVGCSGAPPAPTSDQERLTLDEYRARSESGRKSAGPAPVVLLPQGTLIKLRVPALKADLSNSPLLRSTRGSDVRQRLETPFETIQEPELVLRVREPLQLDLERFQVSRDGSRWRDLSAYFVPALAVETQFVVTDPQRRDVSLPAWAMAELIVTPPLAPRD